MFKERLSLIDGLTENIEWEERLREELNDFVDLSHL